MGSWTISTSAACNRSNVASRSLVASTMIAYVPFAIISRDETPLLVGGAGVDGRRMQNHRRIRLIRRADCDPTHLSAADVETNLEAQHVAVERQRLLPGHHGEGRCCES